jgi:hypothetical protein
MFERTLHNKAIPLAMKNKFQEALDINKKGLQPTPDWPPADRFRERLLKILSKE